MVAFPRDRTAKRLALDIIHLEISPIATFAATGEILPDLCQELNNKRVLTSRNQWQVVEQIDRLRLYVSRIGVRGPVKGWEEL